jgi:hypothetical protein
MSNVQKSKKAKKYIVVAKLSDGPKIENTEKRDMCKISHINFNNKNLLDLHSWEN